MGSNDLRKTLRVIDLAIEENLKVQKNYVEHAKMLGLPLFKKLAKIEKSQEKALRKLRSKIRKKKKKGIR